MKTLKKADYKTTQTSDEVVISRILEGEKELFEILMRRYNQTLYRAVRSYLKTEKEIEDAMQEAYLKAFWKLNQFKHEALFSTWLVRIGINEALQRIRKRSNNQPVKSLQDEEYFIQPESQQMDPEKEIINNETHQLLEKAIDELSEKYRVVYVLREIEGMEHKAIAECLDLSESNVKVRFHRSKKMLKEKLYAVTGDVELFEFGNSRCDRLVENVMKRI